MLINAQTPEELRLAIVTGSTLDTYQVEAAEGGLTRGNIYRGLIANVQPSLNAAFIDYGAERNGFLAIQDVVEDAWYRQPKKKGGRPKIEDVLDRGKPIVVQVTREPEGQKGAALTTNLSLAGRYLVLTPFDSTRGVSRKVEDDDDRKHLKQIASQLKMPKGCGVIVRTNALDQTKTTLSRDFAALLRLWKQVQTEARQGKSTRLLYSDQDLVLQALRDYLDSSIEEVLVDSDEAHKKAREYLRAFLPRGKTKLVRYKERTPLFSKYNLEPQIDRIYERRVELESGGSIVIDRTEALTAIDVNSGRSTRGASQEETAVHTNLEAAKEAARQLRLRDIGGLLVVDFIDMRSQKSRRRVEKALRDAMKADKARSRVGRISANGLLEINRQRIHQALSLRTHRPCPTCDGTGRIASPEMVGLSLLRRIEARAATGTLQKVRIALHPELADAFQNGRRREISALEQEFDIRVEVTSATHLHRPEQEVDWFSRPRSSQRTAASQQPAEPSVRVTDVTATSSPARPTERPGDREAEEAADTTGRRRRRRKRAARPAETKAKKDQDTKERDKESKTEARPATAKETKKEEKEPEKGTATAKGKVRETKTSRRRGRRRKSEEGKDKLPASATERGASKKGEAEETPTPSTPVEDAVDETKGGGRRRSRRRRGSAAKKEVAEKGTVEEAAFRKADDTQDTATKIAAGRDDGPWDEGPSEEAEPSGSPARRRARRRRKSPGDQSSGKGSDGTVATTARAEDRSGAEPGSDSDGDRGEERAAEGDPGTGRRRPRRRRSRRRKEDAAADA
jgi:ribonuclease E